MLFRRGKTRQAELVAALDIGSSYTKLVIASCCDAALTVRLAESLPTPPGAVDRTGVLQVEALAAPLRRVVDSAGALGCRAYGVVGGRSIVLRRVTLPPLSRAEALLAARVQASRVLPLPPGEAAVDVVLCPGMRHEGELRWEQALLIAAPKATALRYADCMTAAGLQPAGIDVYPLALLRALARGSCSPLWEGHPYAILAIGAAATELVIAAEGLPAFCRTLDWGTSSLPPCCAEEAEAAAEAREGQWDSGPGTWSPESAASLLRLSAEVSRSLAHYQRQFREGNYRGIVRRLVLAGGGAHDPRLGPWLTSRHGVAVVAGNPFAHLSAQMSPGAFRNLSSQSASFAACLGLLRSGEPSAWQEEAA